METTAQQSTHDEIAVRAYELWEQRGRPQGYDLEFWLEAERQMRSGVELYQEQFAASAQSARAVAVEPPANTSSRPASLARAKSGWRTGIKGEGEAKHRTPRRTIPRARQATPAARR